MKKTAEQFVEIPMVGATGAEDTIWYRTGDLARADSNNCLYYLGRVDNQVQVRGHRVELLEVDHVLRDASGTDWAIAVPWPGDEQLVEAIYAFISRDSAADRQHVLDHCRRELPEYAIPREVFRIEEFPLNANGKIDRRALQTLVGELRHGAN